MQFDLTAVLVAIIFGGGVMALLAISYGVIHRSITRLWLRSVLNGFTFALGSILVMLQPVQLSEGIIFDARSIIVGIGAAFGGWPTALIAGGITAGYRLMLGGVGAPTGAVGILLAAGLGLVWAWKLKPKGKLRLPAFVGLGALLALNTASVLILPYDIMLNVLTTAVPVIAVFCVIGAAMMGPLIERERHYIRSEKLLLTNALTDPLTTLLNRRGFRDSVDRKLSVDNLNSNALVLVDADHFKRLNDRYGHAAGDEALVKIAQILRSITPEFGDVGRVGGEEFAVFLPNISRNSTKHFAELLCMGIGKTEFRYEGSIVPLSVSIGVAMSPGRSGTDLQDLLKSADRALYFAKSNGRNRVIFADAIGD